MLLCPLFIASILISHKSYVNYGTNLSWTAKLATFAPFILDFAIDRNEDTLKHERLVQRKTYFPLTEIYISRFIYPV